MSVARQPVNDISEQKLIRVLGYTFSNLNLFRQALTHRSVGAVNNERLEFLGDSLLNTIIAEALFEKFPRAKEGQLSRMRAQLVKGDTLAEVAREFNIGDCLILGEGEMKSGGHRRSSILADTVEALLAAIYLDSNSNFEVCRERVLDWFSNRLHTISLTETQKDAKSQLQEYLQGRGAPLPEYEIVQTDGAAHEQQFTVSCKVSLLSEPVITIAHNKRQAEKAAASIALQKLESLP
ncbi:MAG: ribonuclease III [Cellvibrionaceae bacterium]